MPEHAVVIAGGGPTGLMLAAELALAKIDVAIVERRPNQELEGMRARGLHARTIEVLDQRGVADRFVSEGQKYPASMFTGAKFMTDLPTRHNYTLALGQKDFERILAGWVDELGVKIYRGRDVTGFTQDDTGVDVAVSDGSSLRAQYLVGCDGGRSLIRKTAGIGFPGTDASQSWLIAEAHMTDEPKWGFHEDALGKHAIGKADGGLVGLVVIEREVEHANEPTLSDVSEALIAVYGTDYGIHNPRWISRFTDMTRQAAAYRDRRVLLAGDAAHLHPPVGGQGLGMGVQDSVNLGWKLAQVIKGISPDSLLDTYYAERHPVATRVLRTNIAQVTLARPGDRMKALRDTMNEVLALDEPSRRITAMMSGLDIHYDVPVIPSEARDLQLDKPHQLLGRRMPDLDIVTSSGTVRIFTLLHAARPVLMNFQGLGGVDVTPWRDRVQVVDARYDGAWELPAIGAVTAPTAVLIRPDGYVAWVGEGTQAGLVDALTTWFG
jgi:3-(3-hydroxy-phenyl)propionate hydroxylase